MSIHNTPTQDGLASANFDRSKAASSRDVARAREAIKAIQAIPVSDMTLPEIQMRQRYLQVLTVRVQYPTSVLRHLAARCGVTKDVYSARLRRSFAFAERMSKRYEQ